MADAQCDLRVRFQSEVKGQIKGAREVHPELASPPQAFEPQLLFVERLGLRLSSATNQNTDGGQGPFATHCRCGWLTLCIQRSPKGSHLHRVNSGEDTPDGAASRRERLDAQGRTSGKHNLEYNLPGPLPSAATETQVFGMCGGST